METIFTTVKHDQYGEVLLKDGKETICPYKPSLAVPAQNALGQMTMQIISFPCCTSCPLAHTEQFGVNDGTHYIISCTNNEKDIELTSGTDDSALIINL
jgi:hypothetical protein